MAGRWRAYLQLIRAPAVFSAVSNVLAAQLLVSGGSPGLAAVALSVISGCLYAGGMVLNDCFDIARDRLERPARPLPSGEVPLKIAWMLGGALLLVGLILAAVMGAAQFLITFALVFFILVYNARAKNSSVGSLVMGVCRYLNWLLGLSTVAFSLQWLLVPAPVLLYITGLTLLSRQESGEIEPVCPVAAILWLFAAFSGLLTLLFFGVLNNIWAIPVLFVLAAPAVHRLWILCREPEQQKVRVIVSMLIYGIIPIDALLVLGAGYPLGALAILFLLLPARLTGRYLYVT